MVERRGFKPEEKIKIVMEGLNGTIEITELCRKYGIGTARFYSRKEKLLMNSAEIYDDKGWRNPSVQRIIAAQKEEISRHKDVIAEITQEKLEINKRLEIACRGGQRHEITVL